MSDSLSRNTLSSFPTTATFAVVNAVVVTGTLHAQVAAPAKAPDEPVKMSAVVVKEEGISQGVPLAKFSQSARDTPQSIDFVSRHLMDEQAVSTLRDALRNVAGISLAAGEGGSQGDNLTLRGFTARNDIFLDGMRDFGSYYRDPFNTREVAVLKGPSSVIFGRGSTGGVIDQESKTPDLHAAVSGSAVFATDETRRGTVDINEPLSDAHGSALRVNLMGHEAGMAGRHVAETRRFGVAPALAFGLNTPTRATLRYFHQSENDIPDYGVPWYFNRPAPVARTNFYGFTDDYLRTDVDLGSLKVQHDVSHDFTVSNQARYARYAREFRITEPQILAGTATLATPLTQINVNRNELAGRSVETLLGDDLDATAHFVTGAVAHQFVFGFEALHETSAPIRYASAGVPGANLIAPNQTLTFTGTPTVSSRVNTVADSVAGYAVDTVELGKAWTLTGGFRWDRFASDYTQGVAPAAAFSRVDTMPSWRGAIVYKPLPNGSVYFDAGNSFNPSAEALALSAATANTPPEKSVTYEIGTKWDLLDKKLAVRGAIYRTDKTNAREPDPNNATLNVLGGEQRVDGFEVEASGHLTNRWEVSTGFSLMDSQVVASQFYPASLGAQLANVPKEAFNAWTSYELPCGFEVGGGGQYVGSRTASSTVPFDPVTGLVKQVPGYWVFNAMVKYPISNHLEAQVNVANLANRATFDEPHPAHIVLGPGRSVQLSLNFKY